MHIVFCADRRVLPGLHVAAYSLLDRFDISVSQPYFTIFSDALDETDIDLLHQTLQSIGKPYALTLNKITLDAFSGFPPLNGSWATYYRLHAAQTIEAERFLYVDADTLCDVDVSELQTFHLGNYPAAWVPEAPLNLAADYPVAKYLKGQATDFYFNAGIILINSVAWRQQNISERAMDYIATYKPIFHDQSALNIMLHRNVKHLHPKFNCMSNIRKNWAYIRQAYGEIGRLVHFIDYPKPWDLSAEWFHPQYDLWSTVLKLTAMQDFKSWNKSPTRRIPRSKLELDGYKKAAKDRILFNFYRRGLLGRVKGM